MTDGWTYGDVVSLVLILDAAHGFAAHPLTKTDGTQENRGEGCVRDAVHGQVVRRRLRGMGICDRPDRAAVTRARRVRLAPDYNVTIYGAHLMVNPRLSSNPVRRSNPMSLSMYKASVPVFIRGLGALSAILDKAAAHAEAKKIDPAVFINARLAPDMFPLARQVQAASDAAKACVARLAGIAVPSYADTETTFPELQARIAKTVAFLQSADAEQIDGSEERTFTLKLRSSEATFRGQPYLLTIALPNFFFHVTTAYDILRHNGLEIGKLDYLGQF